MKRLLHIQNDVVQVKPTDSDLKVTGTGVIYLMNTGTKDDKFVYKLHQFPDLPFEGNKTKHLVKSDTKKWLWIAMWNSVVHTGNFHKTMEDALLWAINKGNKVIQMSQNDLYGIDF